MKSNVAGSRFAGYGTTDLRSHFATTSLRQIERALHSCANEPPAVSAVVSFLDDLHSLPGDFSGLPIGPEASAPLGTFALRALDLRLLAHEAPYRRYVDDYTVFTDSEASFQTLVDEVDRQAQRGGQRINRAKTEYWDCDDIRSRAGRLGGGPSMSELDSESNDDPIGQLAAAIDLGRDEEIPPLLALLRSNGDPRGIQLLSENRWITRQFPRQVGAYLRVVRRSVEDWDWIVEEIVEGINDRDRAAAALHLLPAVQKDRLSPSVAGELLERALGASVRDFSPARAMVFFTLGRSSERGRMRTSRALELADAVGDLNEKRALVGSLRIGGSLGRTTRVGIQHLAKVSPDLEATTEWALAS